jgi:hypothetical protein
MVVSPKAYVLLKANNKHSFRELLFVRIDFTESGAGTFGDYVKANLGDLLQGGITHEHFMPHLYVF